MHAAARELARDVGERGLAVTPEPARGVAGKARGRRDRIVRRVEVDEVAALGVDDRVGVADVEQLGMLEHVARGVELVREQDLRVLVPPLRDVELTRPVDAPEAVEARAVQIDERRGVVRARVSRLRIHVRSARDVGVPCALCLVVVGRNPVPVTMRREARTRRPARCRRSPGSTGSGRC